MLSCFSAGAESFQVILSHQEIYLSVVLSLGPLAPGDHPTLTWQAVSPRSLWQTLKDWTDFVAGRRNSALIQPTPLVVVPSPILYLFFCPPCPGLQSRASISSQPVVQGQHSLGNILQLRDSPRRWEKGRTILGDGDPPPLLPVPVSSRCRSVWHCCGSTVRMLPMLLSPPPCADAMARHRQHWHRQRWHWHWHQQAAGKGPRELQL